MNRRWALFLTGNLALLLVLLWAHGADLTVTLRVEGNTLVASLEGYTLQTLVPTSASPEEGAWVGLYWGEPVVPPTTPLARFQEKLASLLYHPYWGDVTVTSLDQGDVPAVQRWTGPFWRSFGPTGAPQAVMSFPIEGIQNYELKATLGRGEGFSGIVVGGQSPGDGYLFWFRPLHEDRGWQVLRGGRGAESMTSSGFRMSLPQAIKPGLRILLGSYFVGLLMAGLFWLTKSALRRGIPAGRSGTLPLYWPEASVWLWALVAMAALAAAVVTAWINTELLGRIPHVQDSVAYLFQAKTFALGRLAVPSPPLPQFFEHEFILNRNGLWFSMYPPGHPLMLALGVLAGYPWLVGPVEGGLFLVVLFFLGRELYGRTIGALAVLLGLSSPFFLFMSASFMAHPTSLLFITLFMLAFVKTPKGASPGWGILAGFALGMTFITRQLTALALALPFAAIAAYGLMSRPRSTLPRYALMMLGAAPPLFFYFWYNWQLTGSPLTAPLELWWDFNRLGFGPNIGMRGGHTPAEGFINTWRNLNALVVHLFGWPPYFTLALSALPFALGRARGWDWLLGAAFLSLVGAHVFLWADGIMYGPRYYYEALPALLLLSARGLQGLAEVGPGRKGIAGSAGLVLAGALLFGLLSSNLTGYMPQQLQLYRNYNYVGPQALETVRRADLHQAVVFVEHEPTWQWWKYGAVFSSNSPLLDTDVVYARDLGDRNRELAPFFSDRSFYALRGGRLFPLDLGGSR